MSVISIILYVIGGVIFFLPDFYARWRFERMIELDLVEESESYRGVSKLYRNYALISSLLAISFFFIMWNIFEPGTGPKMEVLMALVIVIFISCLTTSSGLIAIQRNAYPTSKYYGSRTSFAFDYDGNVKKYGRIVTTIAGSTAIISLMAFVIIMFFT